MKGRWRGRSGSGGSGAYQKLCLRSVWVVSGPRVAPRRWVCGEIGAKGIWGWNEVKRKKETFSRFYICLNVDGNAKDSMLVHARASRPLSLGGGADHGSK